MTQPLSALLGTLAERLHHTAHLVALINSRLGAALIIQTALLRQAEAAALALERELRATRRTADALAAEISDEAATARRARYAGIIAGILPTPPGGTP